MVVIFLELQNSRTKNSVFVSVFQFWQGVGTEATKNFGWQFLVLQILKSSIYFCFWVYGQNDWCMGFFLSSRTPIWAIFVCIFQFWQGVGTEGTELCSRTSVSTFRLCFSVLARCQAENFGWHYLELQNSYMTIFRRSFFQFWQGVGAEGTELSSRNPIWPFFVKVFFSFGKVSEQKEQSWAPEILYDHFS